MGKILHITSQADWMKAQKEGRYTAPSFEKEGFIHCSLAHQIVEVANYNFKGKSDLVLLEMDEAKLQAEVKYEDLYNLNEDFPHIYGAINLDAVIRVIPFPHEPDGSFQLPSSVGEA